MKLYKTLAFATLGVLLPGFAQANVYYFDSGFDPSFTKFRSIYSYFSNNDDLAKRDQNYSGYFRDGSGIKGLNRKPIWFCYGEIIYGRNLRNSQYVTVNNGHFVGAQKIDQNKNYLNPAICKSGEGPYPLYFPTQYNPKLGFTEKLYIVTEFTFGSCEGSGPCSYRNFLTTNPNLPSRFQSVSPYRVSIESTGLYTKFVPTR